MGLYFSEEERFKTICFSPHIFLVYLQISFTLKSHIYEPSGHKAVGAITCLPFTNEKKECLFREQMRCASAGWHIDMNR